MEDRQFETFKMETFQSPNRVLCYGAGIVGHVMAEAFLRAGFSVAGFIDKNKQGTTDTAAGALPIYSISAAARNFQENSAVIITVDHAKLFPEITADLIAAGFSKEQIYPWNLFTWMTIPSPKCYCEDLFKAVLLDSGCLMKCCFWGENRSFRVELLRNDLPFENTLEDYARRVRHYRQKAMQGEVPIFCAGCSHLQELPPEISIQHSGISFAASAQCNLSCIYCNVMEEVKTASEKFLCRADGYGEMFLTLLQYFEQHELIAPQADITLAGGELTISPKRKELLDFVLAHPNYRYHIFSNCVIYDEQVARVLEQNPGNSVMCDLDSGTAETYTLVKGYNYFDRVVKNLKEYTAQGHVDLKYIVIPGFNDSQADRDGTIRILKEIGSNELILSREHFQSANPFQERKVLFEVARFKKTLVENGIIVSFFPSSFDDRQFRIIDHLYRQLCQRSDEEASI